jgi:CelD/BcsL family acetyltransferase involved in cellulose biosynthesis
MSAGPELLKVKERAQGDRPRDEQVAYSTEWLSQHQHSEWDTFVQRHASGTVYHTTEWKKALEQAFPHIRGRFLALREKNSGQLLGGLPVYHVRSWLLGRRLVSIPFATVCDPLVTTLEEWNALAPELERECQTTRSKKMEIRAVLTPGHLPSSFGRRSLFKHHSLPLDIGFEALRLRFDKQSVRQKAEKARKAGVVIEERNDRTAMAISHALLAMTRRRLSLPPMPYRFFEAIHNNLRAEHLKIFLAYQNSQAIACHIVLIFRDQWISEYSANADGAISGVNQLLYLETIRQACAQGAQRFSYGRTSTDNEGLLSYKRRWGTVEEKLTDYTLRRTGAPKLQVKGSAASLRDSRLYNVCKQAIARTPMPVCKLIGNFCYRHLG